MATPRTVARNSNRWNAPAPGRRGLILDGETELQRTRRRLESLKAERASFEPQIKDIARLFAPGRVRITASEANNGGARHGSLLNNTPLVAARTMASGLHAGLTSPARPWFRLLTPDRDLSEFGPMRVWLTQLERRVANVFAKSNLYTALPYCYGEVGLFGTMAMLALESGDEKVMRFEPYTFGQYWIARNEFGMVDTLYKITVMSVRNVVQKFGLENCSQSVQDKYRNRGQMEARVEVLCAIEPNVAPLEGWGPRGMAWQSVYWEINGSRDDEAPLRRSGFQTNPILSTCWELTAGDIYATTCPGMMALGSAKGLQVTERNKAQALQRMNNPPLQGPPLKAGVSLLPGAYNAHDMTNANSKIQSVYDYRPEINGLLDDIRSDEAEINAALFVDLFLMLANDARAQPPTAEEIRARYEEKVLALGPTLEQFNGGLLAPLIDRTTDAIFRENQPYWEGRIDGEPSLPPPPEEIQSQTLNVDFISSLQQAQRAASLTNIERFGNFVGAMMQSNPEAADKFDVDQAIDEYGSGLNVPGGIVRDDDTVAAIRQNRQQVARVKQMAEMAPALQKGAQGIKDLAGAVPVDGSVLQNLSGMATGIGTAGA